MSTSIGNDSLHKRENEAKLMEASAIGNLEDVKKLVEGGVNVNAQNIINHWTALHWACKRGHRSIVSYLLKHQADQSLETINHETCWQLASEPDFSVPFTGKIETKHKNYMQKDKEPDKTKDAKPAFTPNYLANPPFPFISSSTSPSYDNASDHHYINDSSDFYAKSKSEATSTSNDLVLKVKLEGDKDFIEMDVTDVGRMTYNSLLSAICKELGCSGEVKLRKLPNTIIRNDRDITRLSNYQEIEVFFS